MQATLTDGVRIFEDFCTWWLRQMRALTFGWRVRPALPPDARIVAVRRFREEPPEIVGEVLLRRHGRETETGAIDLRMTHAAAPAPLPTGLRLPVELTLHRSVVLPLAAEREAATLLRHEMDRLTPFDAAEVFWGIAAMRRDPQHLMVTLIVVPRQPVEPILEALQRVGLRPSFLETDAGRIEIFRAARRRLAGNALLYGLCGVLAAACLAVPVLRQQAALTATAAQIAALAPAQQEASRLRARLSVAASSAAATRRSGDALRTLATLTAALPDGTSLSDLTLKAGDLTIDGQSSNAARLIALLAAARLADPQFAAPVTRAVDGQADLFSIHATVPP